MEQEQQLDKKRQNIAAEITESVIGIDKQKFNQRLESLENAAQEKYDQSEGLEKIVDAVDLLNAKVARNVSKLSPTLVGTATGSIASGIGASVWTSALK